MDIIYRLTHIETGKKYIGKYSGTHFNDYWGSGIYIKRAIKKHGRASFTKEILEECSPEALSEREIFHIANENTMHPNGYNLSPGGTGGGGGWNHLTEEEYKERQQLHSEIQKRNWEEKREKYIAGFNTEERKAAVAKGVSESWKDPEVRRKKIESMKAYKVTDEHRENNRRAQLGKRWMNKCGKNKHVVKSEIERYLADRWEFGRIVKPTGKKWMTNGEQAKSCSPEEVAALLEKGWRFGRK